MGKLISPKLICFLFALFACTACVLSIWGTKLNRFSSTEFYRDTEAIYDYYFSRYNLPPEVKQQLLTELGMIVNALTLKEKQGESVAALALVTGEIAERRLGSAEIQREIDQIEQSLQYYHNLVDDRPIPARHPHGSLVLDPAMYRGKCTSFNNYIKQQSQLVADNGLPYAVSTRTTQVMDINGNHFLKETNDLDMLDNPAAMANNEQHRIARYEQLHRFPWHNGDIVFGHRDSGGGDCSIQGYWNHVGIYAKTCNCLIDVWYKEDKADAGGIRHSDFSFWAESFDDIAVLRLDALTQTERNKVIEFATEHLGEPYNLSTYKRNPSGGWYCSKLVYQAFLQIGIDLDRGGGIAVFPDDIAVSQGLDTLQCL